MRLTGLHLGLAALISFVLFSANCLAENFLDESYFAKWFAKVEMQKLSQGLTTDSSGRVAFDLSAIPPNYVVANSDRYAFRIWDRSGRRIAGANVSLVDNVSPVHRVGPDSPDTWQMKFAPEWFAVAAGRKFIVAGQPAWIEVATRGDPAGLRFVALWHDFVHDVLKPLVPTLVIAAGLALFSLRRALVPVAAAAERALQLDPRQQELLEAIPTDGLPREVLSLANATNTLFARTNELMNAQKEFVARAAHQLRLPLSVLMLDAGRIEDPKARELEQDIRGLSETVDRLLELSRLEGLAEIESGSLHLSDVANDVVLDLESAARERGATVVLECNGEVPVNGEFLLVREALRNVVANAILHHPGSARVVVRCGPGPVISVDDDGPGLCHMTNERLFAPFSRGATKASGAGLGLAITKKVTDLHGASIEVGRSHLGGARFVISFRHHFSQEVERQGDELMDGLPLAAE